MKRFGIIAISITFFVLSLGFIFPDFFKAIDSKGVDLYFRIRGVQPHSNDIVLVTIDEESVNKLGRWPWRRSVMAQLVETLSTYQPKAIGFDITFSEPTSEDENLANAFKKVPQSFLGYFFYLSPEEVANAHVTPKEIAENEKGISSSRLAQISTQLEQSGRRVYGVQTNVPAISSHLEGNRQGFFNIFPDPDGVIRSGSVVLFYKGGVYPSLALQLASFAKGFSPIPLFSAEGTLEGLSLGETKIPLNPKGEFNINYRGPGKTFPHISIASILEGKISPDQLKNKIVLVGATAIGIYDMRVTPIDSNYPGMEISANIIDNILKGDFLMENETTRLLSFGLLLFTGLFFGLVIPRFRPLASFVVFLIFMSLLTTSGYFFFVYKNWMVFNFKPIANGVLVYGGITIYRYFTEERERRKIKKTFQHYLSPAVIKHLLEHPEQLHLGGDRKELTVLFSDIRGFTSKSEKLPPEKLVALLNDYFTAMTDVVFQYEGTVDKYMGDAIMAFFGAPLEQPDHALKASLTALEMAKKLSQNKKEWCKKYGIDDLQIGIGIHTGMMVVGNMGSAKRFNYTVIGDAVNLASRLEGLNKEYGTQILISEAHYNKVKDHVTAKKLGEVQVKGKEESVAIYNLLSLRA